MDVDIEEKPVKYFHLSEKLYIYVGQINNKVCVKICERNVSSGCYKELLLSAFTWESFSDSIDTAFFVDIPSYYEVFSLVLNKLFLATVPPGNNDISVQRFVLKNDASREFLEPVIIFSEKEWNNLKKMRDKITKTVITLRFNQEFKRYLNLELEILKPFSYQSEVENQLEAEICLVTSLSELCKESLSNVIDTLFECDGCVKGHGNQLGHTCLYTSAQEKLDKYFNLAISKLDFKKLAEDFTEYNNGLLHYITSDFFESLNVDIFYDTVKLLYCA